MYREGVFASVCPMPFCKEKSTSTRASERVGGYVQGQEPTAATNNAKG